LVSPDVDVWRPIDWARDRNRRPDYSALRAAARLAPAGDPAVARAELDALAGRLAERYPDNLRGPDGTPEPLQMVALHEATVQRARSGLGLLLGGVTLLLAIACLNVAHLFLARGLGRTREMAVRRALGARSGGLVGQLLAESLVVGLLGGVLGILLAWAGLGALLSFRPGELPIGTEVRLDLRVLAFAAVVAVGTAVAFGLLPALRSLGAEPTADLGGSSRGASSSRGVTGFQRGIVVAEVALSLMLVALTGLLMGSYRQLHSVDPGFDADPLWTIPLSPTAASSPLEYHEAMDAVAASLADLPGVESAAYGLLMPFEITGGDDCCWNNRGMVAGGRTHEDVRVLMQPVHADYFATLGIPLLHGTGWSGVEPGATPVPVVLSERLAREFFGSVERALGEGVSWERMDMRVVGVAGNTRDYGFDQPPPRYLYLPSWTVGYGFGRAHAAVRLRGAPPPGLARALRRAVWDAMPGIPVPVVRPMTEWMRGSTAGRQFNSVVFAAFGLVSLMLAAAGLYGTLLYHVRQKRRELGIRLALGAAPSRVEGETVLSGVKLAGLGCALGMAGTWLAGGVLSRWIPELDASDPLALSGAAVVLLGTAALASWLPARGAGRTDVRATLGAE
jgi:predicted permease